MDAAAPLRNSHDNPEVKLIYNNYLGAPLSEKSHQLLHTEYHSRADRLNAQTPEEYV
jgi:iron only hydrogenase large subunit-like protein